MPNHQKAMDDRGVEVAPVTRKREIPDASSTIHSDWLTQLADKSGIGYQLRTSSVPANKALFEGSISIDNLGFSLQVHASNSLELDDLDIRIELPPMLTVSVLLQGEINASLDDIPLCFSADQGPVGHVWASPHPAIFTRTARRGQRIRKVNISVPHQWVHTLTSSKVNATDHSQLDDLLVSGLPAREWIPSKGTLRCAENILAIHSHEDALSQISMGMWVLEILYDALSQFENNTELRGERSLSDRDVARARAVSTFITRHIHHDLDLAQIAAEMNMSVSTLQRLFKNFFGITVIEFLRIKRLEAARHALIFNGISVSEAAYLAGYQSAPNFSTAFRKEYGYPPSHCMNTASSA